MLSPQFHVDGKCHEPVISPRPGRELTGRTVHDSCRLSSELTRAADRDLGDQLHHRWSSACSFVIGLLLGACCFYDVITTRFARRRSRLNRVPVPGGTCSTAAIFSASLIVGILSPLSIERRGRSLTPTAAASAFTVSPCR